MISKKTLDNTFMGKTYIHSKEIQTLRSLKGETLDHVKKVTGSGQA